MRDIGPNERLIDFFLDIDSIITFVEVDHDVIEDFVVDWLLVFREFAYTVFIIAEEGLTVEGRDDLIDGFLEEVDLVFLGKGARLKEVIEEVMLIES